MLSFPVLKERDAREGSSVRSVSGALKGVLGENLLVASEKDVCVQCCLHWPQTRKL